MENGHSDVTENFFIFFSFFPAPVKNLDSVDSLSPLADQSSEILQPSHGWVFFFLVGLQIHLQCGFTLTF